MSEQIPRGPREVVKVCGVYILTLEGEVCNLEAFVLALGSRNNGGIADQWIMDTWVRNQVGLELVEIDVESTVKTQRRSDGAHNLGDQTIEMLVRGPGDIQVATANVVDSFVIDEESTVRVLNGAVRGEDGIVRLNNRSIGTRRRVNGELELGLLAILSGKAFQHESTETRAGAATEGVEDQKALKRVAVVYPKFPRINFKIPLPD